MLVLISFQKQTIKKKMAKTKTTGEDSHNMMEKNIFDYMQEFMASCQSNPVSGASIVVAKDLGYHDQESNEAFMLLLPIAEHGSYVFIKPYLDNKSDMVRYTLSVACITDLVWNDGLGYSTFTLPHYNSERNKFSKGIRYCLKLKDYFDCEKNSTLFKAIKKPSSVHVPDTKFFDSDKKELQASGGFVEISCIKIAHDGESYIASLIKSQRSANTSGERSPSKVFMILSEEWNYLYHFLKWACEAYHISEGETPLEQTRIRNAQQAILSSLINRKKRQQEESSSAPPTKKVKDGNNQASKKKKGKSANPSTKPSTSLTQGISAEKSTTALKNLPILPRVFKSSTHMTLSAKEMFGSTDTEDEENGSDENNEEVVEIDDEKEC